jgi:hypothetical protein
LRPWLLAAALVLVVLLAVACSDQTDYPYYICSDPKGSASCDIQTFSGGAGVTNTSIAFGRTGGTFTLYWEAYAIADQFQVIYEGKVLFDTGSVSWDGSQDISYCGGSKRITVRATAGTSASQTESKWQYSVSCPPNSFTPPCAGHH